MPYELKSKDEFEKLLEGAVEIRVHKDGEAAKVKVKTGHGLFTLKTTSEEADALVKGAKAPVQES